MMHNEEKNKNNLINSFLEGLQNHSLTVADLSQQNIDDETIKLIAEKLKANNSLTTLLLHNNKITDKGLTYLLEALISNYSLTELSLYGNWNHPGNNLIAAIKGRKVSNNSTDLNKAYLRKINYYLRRNHILFVMHNLKDKFTDSKLDLSEEEIDETGVIGLMMALEKMNAVTEVYFSKTKPISRDSVKICANLLEKNYLLKDFSFLKPIDVDPLDLQKIRQYIERNRALSKKQELKAQFDSGKIILSLQNVGDKGIKDLLEKSAIKPITVLRLDHTGISVDGIKILANYLEKNQTVTELNLAGNHIGDEGAQIIAYMLQKNQTLQRLDLNACDISTKGLLALARGLERNQSIKELDLRRNDGGGLITAQAFSELLMLNTTIAQLKLPIQYEMLDKLLTLDHANSSLALCQAAKSGDLKLVEALCFAGANLEQHDNEGNTPLCLAAKYGHMIVAEFLINEGADIHHKNKKGEPPFGIAAKKGHEAVVTQLIDHTENLPTWLAQSLKDIKNPSITSLDLHSNYYFPLNKVINKHIRIIATALLENKTITSLNLANNAIGETGLQFLKQLLQTNKALIEINLDGNECYQRPIRVKTLVEVKALLEKNKKESMLQQNVANELTPLMDSYQHINQQIATVPNQVNNQVVNANDSFSMQQKELLLSKNEASNVTVEHIPSEAEQLSESAAVENTDEIKVVNVIDLNSSQQPEQVDIVNQPLIVEGNTQTFLKPNI